MSKHKSEDFKLSVLNYYLNNKTKYSMEYVCEIFGCKKQTLSDWLNKYEETNNVNRNNRVLISYKIKQKHVNYALKLLMENKHYSLEELVKRIKKKYDDFDITPQHLGEVIRDNNITRKRTKLKHFPKTRFGKEINLKDELKRFYEKVDKYDLNKIICLDETSIQPYMVPEYCRSKLGTKCVDKTDDNFVFRKFTLLMAISRSGLVGAKIYEKNGMTKERFVDFIDKFIKGKYKHHLIILDNAGSHNNELVKNKIIETKNEYLFSIPYTPKSNAIESYFNQLKYYLKLNKQSSSFMEIKKNIKNAIKQIKIENYKNYFDYYYKTSRLEYHKRNLSTRARTPKNYKK